MRFDPIPAVLRRAPGAILLLLLVPAGCGGGGGASSPDAAVPPDPIAVTGPLGRIDFAYALSLPAEDSTGELRTWAVTAGALPPGLTLAAGGDVQGVPTASGTYEATVFGEGPCGDATCRLVVTLTIDVAEVILLSGYGPFAGVPDNPSWHAVAPLHETLVGEYDVRVVELDVEWEGAPADYLAEYERLQPALAIGSGVAMGETVVRLEQRAANEALGEDVVGVVKNGEAIDPAEPSALTSTLPLADLEELLADAGYPVAISQDAGTYLCNYLFFKIMQRVRAEPTSRLVLGGFVHVTGPEVVSVVEMTEAWDLVLDFLVTYREDLRLKRRRLGDRPVRATLLRPPRYAPRLPVSPR